MAKPFKLEDPGEGIHEAEIKALSVSKGDRVADGDILLTVETDKAAVEVPAPFAGTIEEIKVGVGDIAEVGEVILTYREDGAAGQEGAGRSERADQSADESEASEAEGKESDEEPDPEDADERGDAETREDGEQPRPRQPSQQRPAEDEDANGGQADRAKGKRSADDEGPVPASPATRRLARELGVDLREVEASGPHGRVTADDVRTAAEGPDGATKEARREAEPSQRGAAPSEAPQLPDFSRWGEVERVPLRSIRRATAKQMARSWAQIPHVMHADEVDITALEQWRREHKDAAEEQGGRLTVTVLVMKALAAALVEHPRFNASIDMDAEEIVLKRYCHVAVAVDTEQGLVAPVVRDADRKSILTLSTEVVRLAERARAGELKRDEMQGASITLTNPGPLGGHVFTPIINHPQVAILGLGQARLQPRVEGDLDEFRVVPRLMLPVVLAFDHRVNDGADAARFVSRLAGTLSDTEAMLLSV